MCLFVPLNSPTCPPCARPKSSLHEPLQFLLESALLVLLFFLGVLQGHLGGEIGDRNGESVQAVIVRQGTTVPGDAGQLVHEAVAIGYV